MLKVLDLFSGIGGFSLGLERTGGFKTVAFCEIEDYPRKVLAKHWPDVPIHRDVRELDGNDYAGRTDLICGGYPCQPFSHAGKRKGEEDDRHLWPEVKRLVATIRPTWCLFENVAGHISMGLDQVLSDLEGEGYTSQAVVIPACAVDAPHRRDRVWIVARNTNSINVGAKRRVQRHGIDPDRICYGESPPTNADSNCIQRSANKRKPNAKSDGRDNIARVCEDVSNTQNEGFAGRDRQQRNDDGSGRRRFFNEERSRADDGVKDVADPISNGRQGKRQDGRFKGSAGLCSGTGRDKIKDIRSAETIWLPEPPVGRVAHGIPRRVDRLKGLGNAIVPQVVTMLGNAILEAEIGGS